MADITEQVEEIGLLIDEIKADHITIEFAKSPTMVKCKHCGFEDTMRGGVPLNYSINLLRAFRLTHATCMKEDI